MLLAALIIIGSVVFVLRFWMKPRSLLQPPMYPGALPIIGHAHMLFGNYKQSWNTEKKLYDYALQKGEPVQVRLGTHSVYVISDPDDSLTVANNCLEKPYMYNFAKVMYGRGLTTADVSVWKPHRKLLNLAFNQQLVHTYVEEFITHAKSLVSQLASEVGKGPFEVQPYMISNFFEITCRTTLGFKTDKNSETIKNYAKATEALFIVFIERLQRVWLHIPYIFNRCSYKKKQDSLIKVLRDITETAIKNRKSSLKLISTSYKTLEPAPEQFQPFLDRMLDLADKKGAFTDDEIRDHLDNFIVGAYDTTSITMTFTLVLIGSHQDVQERIYKELKEVLGNEDRELNRHDIQKLVYLEAVIKESLRLYPPAPRFARTSSSDVYLKNYTLPANCTYIISVYGLNRHPSWGADAELFKPERWLDPATLPEKPSTFASFSLGRRNCIGKLYAMIVVKTTLAYILKRYRIKSDIEKLVTQCTIFQVPVAGHQISLELRN